MWRQFNQKKKLNTKRISNKCPTKIINAYIISDALIETCFTRSAALKCEKNNHNKIHFQHFKWVFCIHVSVSNWSIWFLIQLLMILVHWRKNTLFGRHKNKQPNWRDGNFSSKMNKFAMYACANFSIDCFNEAFWSWIGCFRRYK